MSVLACDEVNSALSAISQIKVKPSLSVPIFSAAPRPNGILLDANEFRFPLPEVFLRRVAKELAHVDLRSYPDLGEAEKVKAALAEYHGVDPENIFLGVGSMELLDVICRAFGGSDDKVVTPVPSFPMYAQYANLNERKFTPVPLEDDFTLSQRVAEAMRAVPGGKAFFVCSPNNPTALSIDRGAFDILTSDREAILCLDEAYAEYSDASFVSEAVKRDNVVVTRSFSKIGIAGCRFGYVVASKDFIREIAKGALPYTVNSLTLRIARLFVEAMPQIRAVIEDVKRERDRLAAQLAALPGFKPGKSEANFILCAAPGDALALARRLGERRQIWVKPFPPHTRLRNHLRIAVGLPAENDALIEALKIESSAGADIARCVAM